MLWMMAELFETLPEAGDRPKPKMVFFFDEAHLLFNNASKALLEKVEQVVKLIRSKGVGIYFITQNPADIPDGVLSQLGNKVQHALRAYTPKEQKGAKAAAESFRENPEFDTYEVLSELGIGEALVSVLDEEGIPTVVKQCKILPPQSMMGALDDDTRKSEIVNNLLYTKYTQELDRESAYELLTKKVAVEAEEAAEAKAAMEAEKLRLKEEAAAEKQRAREAEAAQKAAERKAAAQEKEVKRAVKNVARSATGTIGREIGKSIGNSVGGSFGKRLGGNVGASLGRGILNTLFK
jgi:DNA helicase HerA-like ATPase